MQKKIGTQTLQQFDVQSEADYPGYKNQTLRAGHYTGELWEARAHDENAILVQEPDFFINPDQWTTEAYVDSPNNGPWSQPYNKGCQILKLEDFNKMTETLEAIGFEYGIGNTIDIDIMDDENN